MEKWACWFRSMLLQPKDVARGLHGEMGMLVWKEVLWGDMGMLVCKSHGVILTWFRGSSG